MERGALKALTVFVFFLIIRLAIAVQGIRGTDVLYHVNGSRNRSQVYINYKYL